MAMKRALGVVWMLFLAGSGAGCAPDLRKDYPFDGELAGTNHLKNEVQSDGSTRSIVDATNKEGFVYVDLDTGKELSVGEALDTNTWDLAFQRFVIRMNGGGGGLGNVEAAVLVNADFDTLTAPPAEGFQKDGAEPVFSVAEGGWYFYDLGKHKVIAKTELTYVIHSSEGAYFKMKLLDYYDSAGTAANVSFRWAKLP